MPEKKKSFQKAGLLCLSYPVNMEGTSLLGAKHESYLKLWRGRVMECRNSGKTIAVWCKENGINIKTYHPMNKELLMEDCMCEPCEAGGSYDVNMEPDDIEVSDTVTVIWELG